MIPPQGCVPFDGVPDSGAGGASPWGDAQTCGGSVRHHLVRGLSRGVRLWGPRGCHGRRGCFPLNADGNLQDPNGDGSCPETIALPTVDGEGLMASTHAVPDITLSRDNALKLSSAEVHLGEHVCMLSLPPIALFDER